MGVFPDGIKIARVIPLFKNGNINDFTNYRPISLLLQFSKILEKIFHNRIEKYCPLLIDRTTWIYVRVRMNVN